MELIVTTFYKFTSLEAQKIRRAKEKLEQAADGLGVMGLVLLAPEGVNATVAGDGDAIRAYKEVVVTLFGEMEFKDSPATAMPFRRFKVSVRDEIVGLKRTDVQPTGAEPHLSADEWDALMAEDDVVLIDVRNWYETRLGMFKDAVDPKTWHFSQFPKWVQKADLAKDQKIGIYCTGGIRCEKAAVAMKEQGYENVYQLDGGILKYIEERPNRNFEGECFVFDHRVAVKQDLAPSDQYGKCPWCGNAGELQKRCIECSSNYRCCTDCLARQSVVACSKRCRNEHIRKEEANV